jgi:type IV secretory pathway VirB2 component (pilin)
MNTLWTIVTFAFVVATLGMVTYGLMLMFGFGQVRHRHQH